MRATVAHICTIFQSWINHNMCESGDSIEIGTNVDGVCSMDLSCPSSINFVALGTLGEPRFYKNALFLEHKTVLVNIETEITYNYMQHASLLIRLLIIDLNSNMHF